MGLHARVRQEVIRIEAAAAAAHVGRVRADDAVDLTRVGLALAAVDVGITPLALRTLLRHAAVGYALHRAVVARLTERTRMPARIGLAHAEPATLAVGAIDIGATAVALAAALNASFCEICSDVDGVYTADPYVVDAARRLDQISYDEMQELAEHGAKVLNAQAVEWARKAGIQIQARSTNSDGGGTCVSAAASGQTGP